MPVQGLVRLRKHQLARQAVFGTKVPATRAYPFTGTPSVDLQWTDPEIDSGSIDPVAAPYRDAGEFTFDATGTSVPHANPVRKPGPHGSTAVRLTTAAEAPAGTTVDKSMSRARPPPRGGPERVSVTRDGGTATKPVGLVHFACARRGKPTIAREERFGEIGRGTVRLASLEVGLDLLEAALRH